MVVIPEDIDNLGHEEKVQKINELGILDFTGFNIDNSSDLTRLLVENSTITFDLLSTEGPKEEFSQYFENPKINSKLVVYCPIDKIGEPSLLTAQLEKFIFMNRFAGHFYLSINDVQLLTEKYIKNTISNGIRGKKEINREKVKNQFFKWTNKHLETNVISHLTDHDGDLIKKDKNDNILDYIYILINPTNYPNEFTNNTRKMIDDSLKTYFDDFHLFYSQKIHLIPSEYLKIFNDIGEEIKIFPDGKMYISYRISSFDRLEEIYDKIPYEYNKLKKRYLFSPELLLYGDGVTNSRVGLTNKYGISIEKFIRGKLEDFLKIACFIFHPDCKIKFSKNPTNNYTGFFIFHLMKYSKSENRRLQYNGKLFAIPSEYIGEKDHIEFENTFSYETIGELVLDLEKNINHYFEPILNT